MCVHSNIATCKTRLFLCTPRKGRRKLRRAVQIPYIVLQCTPRRHHRRRGPTRVGSDKRWCALDLWWRCSSRRCSRRCRNSWLSLWHFRHWAGWSFAWCSHPLSGESGPLCDQPHLEPVDGRSPSCPAQDACSLAGEEGRQGLDGVFPSHQRSGTSHPLPPRHSEAGRWVCSPVPGVESNDGDCGQ